MRHSGRAAVLALSAVFTLRTSSVVAQARAAVPVRALSLEEALRLAEPASETLLLAKAGVTRAEGEFLKARSNFLPQLNGFAQYQRTIKTQFSGLASAPDTAAPTLRCGTFAPNPALPLGERVDSLEKGLLCANAGQGSSAFANLPFGRPNAWNLGLTGSLTLFNGRYLGQQRAANAGRESAAVELTSQRAQVIVDVVKAYYDAALADRQLAIADSTLAQAERTLKDVELQRQVGNQSEFERLRAAVARDNQKPTVIARRTQRRLARVRLAQLLNLPTAEALELTTQLGDTSGVPLPPFAQAIADAADTAVASRAPVRKAEAALRQQEGLYTAAKLERAPTLTLSSTYQQIAYPLGLFPNADNFLSDWNVVVRMDVPLFTGGRLKGDALSARAGRDEAEARLLQARKQAVRERTDAESSLEGAQAQWASVSGTVEQARTAYAIAEVRFREGLSTQTELSDTRLQLQQAEANRAQAARDLQVARIRAVLLRDLPFDNAAAGAATAATTPAATGATTAAPAVPAGTTGTTTTTGTGAPR